jgi:predicted transcriptional regulator
MNQPLDQLASAAVTRDTDEKLSRLAIDRGTSRSYELREAIYAHLERNGYECDRRQALVTDGPPS